MCNGWTPERRARQAEKIRAWRPWERSTGPRTAEGKVISSRNGDKGSPWKAERDNVRVLKETMTELLREQRDLLRRLL